MNRTIYAYRGTSPGNLYIVEDEEAVLEFILSEEIVLTDCDYLQLDVQNSLGSVIISKIINNPTGNSHSFTLSDTETSLGINNGWLVLAGFYPGDTSDEDNIDPLYISNIKTIT